MDYLPFTRPTIDDDAVASVAEVLRSGWLASGPRVVAFEHALQEYLGGGRYVRAVTSATAALEIALHVAGIGPGDEVLVPALSFAASANVVLRVGAAVRFVDVELRTRNATAGAFEAALGPRTRALMPVHFAGRAVDLDAIYALADRGGLRVIEDAAHAIGSGWRGSRVGSRGDLVCFSFHPNKNITTIEGGAISVADRHSLAGIERSRFHGIVRDADDAIDVVEAGGKFNMPDACAALGLAQLGRLNAFNAARRMLARHYLECLDGRVPPDWLPAADEDGHAWHLFALLLPFDERVLSRKAFTTRMRDRGIGVGVHYPALPSFSLYRGLGHDPAAFPHAARIGAQTVTLPLFPGMNVRDVERVCEAACDSARELIP